MELFRRLFSGFSKPTLASILALMAAFAVERAWAWRQGVDAHVLESDKALFLVERGQRELRDELREFREEERQRGIEQQRQFLEQFRWLAEHQFGDKTQTRALDKRLRELKDE